MALFPSFSCGNCGHKSPDVTSFKIPKIISFSSTQDVRRDAPSIRDALFEVFQQRSFQERKNDPISSTTSTTVPDPSQEIMLCLKCGDAISMFYNSYKKFIELARPNLPVDNLMKGIYENERSSSAPSPSSSPPKSYPQQTLSGFKHLQIIVENCTELDSQEDKSHADPEPNVEHFLPQPQEVDVEVGDYNMKEEIVIHLPCVQMIPPSDVEEEETNASSIDLENPPPTTRAIHPIKLESNREEFLFLNALRKKLIYAYKKNKGSRPLVEAKKIKIESPQENLGGKPTTASREDTLSILPQTTPLTSTNDLATPLVEDIEDSPRCYSCALCDIQFTDKSSLYIHNKTYHVEEKIKNGAGRDARNFCCKYCDARFLRKHFMQRHQKRHEQRYVTPAHQCKKCWRLYRTKDILNKHKTEIHGKQYSFKCLHCRQRFPDVYHRKSHVDKFHRNLFSMEEKGKVVCLLYNCKFCNESMKSKYSLQKHMNIKHPVQHPQRRRLSNRAISKISKHKCSICEAYFENQSKRRFHEATIHLIRDLPQIQIKDCFKS